MSAEQDTGDGRQETGNRMEGPTGPSIRRKLPDAETVVEMTKNTPAPMMPVWEDGFHLHKIPFPDDVNPGAFIVLLRFCSKYVNRKLITEEDWEAEDEINELIKLGLLMESFEASPHDKNSQTFVHQYIPTLYCHLTCISMTEPYQWYLDPFEPIQDFDKEEKNG